LVDLDPVRSGEWLERLPPTVRRAIDLLRTWEVETWLVGGSVRDLLLNRQTHDFDFAVQGDGLEVARRVANALRQPFVVLDEGRRFGRGVVRQGDASAVFLDFGQLAEGDLEADLRQRDFTVNALAVGLSAASPKLVDRVGGVEDLREGVIRAVSDAVFEMDPLRMLRAVRLRAELGFLVEPHTEQLIRVSRDLLPGVAWERVRDEMCRILAPEGAGSQLTYFHDLGLLLPLFPELAALDGVEQSPPHRQDVLRHSFQVVSELEAVLASCGPAGRTGDCAAARAPGFAYEWLHDRLEPFSPQLPEHLSSRVGYERERSLLLKWAALLHDVGKPLVQSRDSDGRIRFFGHDEEGAAVAADVATRLRLNRQEVDALRVIVRHHLRPAFLAREPKVSRRAIYRFFRDAGEQGVDVILLALADHLATWGPGLQAERWERRLEVASLLLQGYYFHRAEAVAPPRLVTGDDLIRLGVPRGPLVGKALEAIREAQVEGVVTSGEEALAWARRWLGQQAHLSGEGILDDGMG